METRLFIQLIFQKYRIEYQLIFPKKIQKSNININLHQMKIQKIELETRLFIQLIFREYRIELIFPRYKNRILIYIK